MHVLRTKQFLRTCVLKIILDRIGQNEQNWKILTKVSTVLKTNSTNDKYITENNGSI